MGDVTSLIFSGGSAAIDAKQSYDQMKLQRRALREQRDAQEVAASASAAQQRRNEEMQARAARRAPNIAALLLGEQELAARPSTLLSGARGVKGLGRNTLLGD